ncbi:hypothetical protein ABIA30_005321 [Mycobacterium sp. MAA66]|jgi:hypothetical protein|uniref:hypothetical protein n=1 Tax=Mycobacterium sp. MAA66 TaxID=3156297 RepID=UPI0035140E83
MKNIKYFAPGLAAVAIGAGIILAPIASANTSPLVPNGTDPNVPYTQGVYISNHDEANQTAGGLDLPF